MKKKIFNKLVRDRITELIEGDGLAYVSRKLSDDEFVKELFNKSQEELTEMLEAKDDYELMKEIGDVYEVIDAIIEQKDLRKDDILNLQKERRHKRGAFKKKIFLEWMEDRDAS